MGLNASPTHADFQICVWPGTKPASIARIMLANYRNSQLLGGEWFEQKNDSGSAR